MKAINSLFDLLFPEICLLCENALPTGVDHLCLICREDLATVKYDPNQESKVAQMLWGRIQTEKVSTFLEFVQHGKSQELLHLLKYKGYKELGVTLGQMAASHLMNTDFFEEIDLIVPLPLHPKKEALRGYNQSWYLAQGVAEVAKIQMFGNNIVKHKHTSSQTKKSRIKRWKNVAATFKVKDPALFEDKHLLLIDDVITTGATLEACSQEILKLKGTKISILTLAAAL